MHNRTATRKQKTAAEHDNKSVSVNTPLLLSCPLPLKIWEGIEIGLYSAIAIYIMGKMIDIVFEGINFTKMIFIVSNKYEEIAKNIGTKIGRGSTGIYG